MNQVTSNKNQAGLSEWMREHRQGARICCERNSLTTGWKAGHWLSTENIQTTQPLKVFWLVLNADLVLSSVLWSLLVIFSIAACLLLGGSRSVLFRTTTMRGQVSSPISRHSAVCVCTPFTTSTTSIIRSMIWAPGERENMDTINDYIKYYGCWKPTWSFDVKYIFELFDHA